MKIRDAEINRTLDQPVERAKKLIGLKNSAYKDYIASRLLFLNDQLHQAAILANTCIEKELKSLFVYFRCRL